MTQFPQVDFSNNFFPLNFTRNFTKNCYVILLELLQTPKITKTDAILTYVNILQLISEIELTKLRLYKESRSVRRKVAPSFIFFPKSGANSTIASYKTRAVKIYNSPNSIARF
jgi:hypothetical protein